MIEIKEIVKEYGKSKKITALNGVSFTMPSVGLVGICGKSGSGKTTLLNILTGIAKPTSGSVIYDGICSLDLNDKDYEILRRQYFGIIFQGEYLYEHLTVKENILIADYIRNNESRVNNSLLEKINIQHLLEKKVCELSGGEKQRVSIARALNNNCKVLIADEPTSNLDEENSKIIFDILKEISKEKLVIVVSHDKEELEERTDILIELSYGKIKKIQESNQPVNIINKTEHTNDRMGFKTFLKLSQLMNKGSFFRRIFNFLFLVLSLTLVITSVSVVSLNKAEYLYNKMIENKTNEYFVVDNEAELNLSDYGYNYQNYFQMKTPITIFDYDIKNVDNAKYGYEIFRNVVLKDIPENKIEITDFTLDMLNYFKLVKEDGYGNLILKINNEDYFIYNVIETNYNSIEYIKESDKFKYYRENIYTNIYVNIKDALDIFDAKAEYYQANEYSFTIDCVKESEFIQLGSLLEGSIIPQNEKEIICSNAFLFHYFKLNDDIDIEEYNKYLNKKIEIEIEGIKEEYKIVGINFSNSKICFFKDEYITICNRLNNNVLNARNSGYFIFLDGKKESINIISTLMKKNKYPTNYGTSKILSEISYSIIFAEIFTYILLFSFVLLGVVSLFFTMNLIKSNKRNIGILASLGISKIAINLLYFFENIKILIFSYIISLPISIVTLYEMGKIYSYDTKTYYYTNIYQVNVFLSLVSFLIVLVMVVIFTYIPIKREYEKDIKDIIYY